MKNCSFNGLLVWCAGIALLGACANTQPDTGTSGSAAAKAASTPAFEATAGAATACLSASDCNDKNACTTDLCKGGLCSNSWTATCCITAADCGDSNACTTDTCVKANQDDASGICASPNPRIGGLSKTSVTIGTADADAFCCNTDSQCDDSNVCTVDLCKVNPAIFVPVDGVYPANAYKTCNITKDLGNPNCCKTDLDCQGLNDVCNLGTCDVVAHQCGKTAKALINSEACALTEASCDDKIACTKDVWSTTNNSYPTCKHTKGDNGYPSCPAELKVSSPIANQTFPIVKNLDGTLPTATVNVAFTATDFDLTNATPTHSIHCYLDGVYAGRELVAPNITLQQFVYGGLGSHPGVPFGMHTLTCALANENAVDANPYDAAAAAAVEIDKAGAPNPKARVTLRVQVSGPCVSLGDCADSNPCSDEACLPTANKDADGNTIFGCVYSAAASCCASDYDCDKTALQPEECVSVNGVGKCSSCGNVQGGACGLVDNSGTVHAFNINTGAVVIGAADDTCTTGGCNLTGAKGFCAADKASASCCTPGFGSCEDGSSCTTDTCTNNVCVHTPTAPAECCVNTDCAGATVCQAAICAAGKCVYGPDSSKAGCCIGTANPNGPCEVAQVTVTGQEACYKYLTNDQKTTFLGTMTTALGAAGKAACDKAWGASCVAYYASVAAAQTLPVTTVADFSSDCNDKNSCTDDACTAEVGKTYKTCKHTPSGGGTCCNPPEQGCAPSEDKCSVATCGADGQCTNVAIKDCCHYGAVGADASCADTEVCTTDTCGADGFCKHTPIANCCHTTAELAAESQTNINFVCNDNNNCTTDTCSAQHVCSHGAAGAGCCQTSADCIKPNGYTGIEKCQASVCLLHQCIYSTNSLAPGCCAADADCDDKNSCTQTDQCTNGTCQHSTPATGCVPPPTIEKCPSGEITVLAGKTTILSQPIKAANVDKTKAVTFDFATIDTPALTGGAKSILKMSPMAFDTNSLQYGANVSITPTVADIGRVISATVTVSNSASEKPDPTCTFSVRVSGAGGYLVYAPGGAVTESAALKAAIITAGTSVNGAAPPVTITTDIVNSYTAAQLLKFDGIFVTLGATGVSGFQAQYLNFAAGHDGAVLTNYLNGGGRLYVEGADAWVSDQPAAIDPTWAQMFGIKTTGTGLNDGFLHPAGTVVTVPSSLTLDYPAAAGSATYVGAGDLNYGNDQFELKTDDNFPNSFNAIVSTQDTGPLMVGHDAGKWGYRAVASSIFIGGGSDAANQAKLATSVLTFFKDGFTGVAPCDGFEASKCPAPDDCHTAPTCDAVSGLCKWTSSLKATGTTCNFSNACYPGICNAGGTCVKKDGDATGTICSGGSVCADNADCPSGACDKKLPADATGICRDTMTSALAAGGTHTCAIRTESGKSLLWCWGFNQYGQLGLETTDITGTTYLSTNIPGSGNSKLALVGQPKVDGDVQKEFTAVATGARHTCAIEKTTSDLWCWGDNASSQLGVALAGGKTKTNTPQLVDNGTWTAIAAGTSHTCGIKAGDVYCWGSNDRFETAGVQGTAATPTKVNTQAATWIGVGAGDRFSCAWTATTLVCWGDNVYGQLGTMSVSSDPANPNVVSAYSWATLEADNKKILGTYTSTSVAVGTAHVCAIDDPTGTPVTRCWGDNGAGQVGNPLHNTKYTFAEASTQLAPTVAGACSITGVACAGPAGCTSVNYDVNTNACVANKCVGSGAACTEATKAADCPSNYCTGAKKCSISKGTCDSNAECGTGAQTCQKSIACVATPQAVTTAVLGTCSTSKLPCNAVTAAAICTGGQTCSGNESPGACAANGKPCTSTVADCAGLGNCVASGFKKCTTDSKACLTNADCTGANNTCDTIVFSKLSAANHTCATTTKGTIWCWGSNTYGEIDGKLTGTGTVAQNQLVPAQVEKIGTNWALPTAGANHSCAVRKANAADAGGQVYCWGQDAYGALGLGPASSYGVTNDPTVVAW